MNPAFDPLRPRSALQFTDQLRVPRIVTAEALLRDARELWIEHRGERYRLYLTRNGKLILTK